MGLADAFEFAAGDDVEACSLFCEETENGEGGVGFDGVTDGVMARGEGLVKELKALRDLLRGVDVEGGGKFCGQSCKVCLIAVEKTVAIEERTGAGQTCDLFRQLETLCGQGIRGFRNDDPRDEIGDGADSGEEAEESCEDTDESNVPAVVKGESGADSRDDRDWCGSG